MRLYSLYLGLWGGFAVVNGRSKLYQGGHLPQTKFKTEPNIALVKFNTSIFPDDESSLYPGYIFISNVKGPQIYDQHSNLVWNLHIEKDHKGQDFRPCDYLGEYGTHLCWHETSLVGHVNTAESRNIVYDSSYEQVGHNYTAGIDGIPPNLHSFHMLPGGHTFLQPVYVPKEWDLTPYKGKKKGIIWDGCFQEIDTSTAKPLFQWCATDHTYLWETSIFFTTAKHKPPPGQTNTTSKKAGHGDEGYPFDFIHINAISKNSENDYIVSARHFDQILKIAGSNNPHGLEPGTTIWRLGGKRNDFDMKDFGFFKQHAVNYVSTESSETVISLFDNAWEGFIEPAAESSSGKIIKVNNNTMDAVLLNQYSHPDGEITGSQGEMQILPNDNIFIGWGELPQVTEYAHDGTVLYHASFESDEYNPRSYRAFKAAWKGRPSTKPKLLAYTRNCKKASPIVAYVSWNGDTEVSTWRFYVALSANGPWTSAGNGRRDGFETKRVLSSKNWLSPFMPYVCAEGINSTGAVLTRIVTETWVPPKNFKKCNKGGCFNGKHFEYKPEISIAKTCQTRDNPAILALIILVLFIEAVVYANRTISIWLCDKLGLRRSQSYSQVRGDVRLKNVGKAGFNTAKSG